MSPDTTRLRALTRGEVSLAQWHRFWRHGLFLCAVGLMSASWFALHWLLVLVGIPDPFAGLVAVVIEVGMAGTATTATTIRKPDGGYHRSLWVIFSFLMLLAQGANVGHAIIAVGQRLADFPPGLPPMAVYIFAGAFAALFPLGGTLFIHVSGFLRVHGADASWVDEGARTVGQRAHARASRTPRTHTDDEKARASDTGRTRAPETPHVHRDDDERVPEPPPLTLTAEQLALPEIERARILWRQARDHGVRVTAGQIKTAATISVTEGQIRRWVNSFREAPPLDAPADDAAAIEAELERLTDVHQEETTGAVA